jgi:hypothetical protein
VKRPVQTRWKLTKIVLSLATFAFFFPPLLNYVAQFVIKSSEYSPLSLLSGAEWVTIVTLILGIYGASNVAKDHIFKQKQEE